MVGWGIALMLLPAGCAGPWKTVPDSLSGQQWSLTSPNGWMVLSSPGSAMLSKDGPYLEYIFVQSQPLEHAFRFTRQRLNAGMLPHEAARLITDNMRSDPQVRQFRLLASNPAVVGGYPGFRLDYSYLDRHDVAIDAIYYGVVLPERFFNLRYTAARRHYFDQELPAFDQVVGSLRLTGGPSAKSP